MFVPVLFGRKRLPRGSINPGGNSQILSAACHASTLLYGSNNETGSHEDATELTSLQSQFLTSSPHAATRNRAGEEVDGYGIGSMTTDSEASELSLLRDSSTLERTISESQFGNDQRTRSLRKLAQSKIRWGVIKMLPDWYEQYAGDIPVEHLGFGNEEDMVSSPVSGGAFGELTPWL